MNFLNPAPVSQRPDMNLDNPAPAPVPVNPASVVPCACIYQSTEFLGSRVALLLGKFIRVRKV